MAEKSTRTKMIEEAPIEEDTMGLKTLMKKGALKASQLADKLGYTQEEEYKDKKPVKKAAGGYVKAADGCAKKGKTKGRMV
jgi:hypothetical protein